MIFEKRSERIALSLLFLVFLLIPVFVEGNSFYVNKVATILILSIFVISLDFLVGKAGLVSLGHALYYGVGGYIFVFLAPQDEQTNFWLYGVYVVFIAGAGAFLMGLVVLRTKGVYFIMITLALGQMFYYLVRDSSVFGGSDGVFITLKPSTDFFGLKLFDLDNAVHFYYFALLSLVSTLVAFKIFVHSKFGRIVEAIRQNKERTESLGYNVFFLQLICYVISSCFAAYAGYLFALQYGFVNPSTMAWQVSGTALVMGILGGLGSIYGAILGVVTYEFLHYFYEMITEDWMLLMGVTIMCMVLLIKGGIAGFLDRLFKGDKNA